MAKKTQRPWQQLGFRSFAKYKIFRKEQQQATSLLSALEIRDERHHREATNREKYHQMRLNYLSQQDIT